MYVRCFVSSLSLFACCSASLIASADTPLVGNHQRRTARIQGSFTVAQRCRESSALPPFYARFLNRRPLERPPCLGLLALARKALGLAQAFGGRA